MSTPGKKSAPKTRAPKLSDAEQVTAYMTQLEHPLKAELEFARQVINMHPKISERIKWNAPSYHVNGVDLVTFNHRLTTKVHLVFHHIAITKIRSPLLEGDYKDRRMTYFNNMAELKAGKKELERIISEYVILIVQGAG
jgi:uncharacterized protein YdhG (YjbR/CyaY superfamily)